MLLFFFFLLLAPQTFVPGLGSLHIAALAVAVACASHITTSIRRKTSILGGHRSVLWAGALAGWALLTAPFSYWPGGTVALLFELYFKSLVVFWLLGAVVDTQQRLTRMVTWLTLLTVPISITAIRHFITGTFVEGGDPTAPRIMGYDAPLTANPNDLALVLCMMLPLAVALAAAHPKSLGRLAFGAIAALDVAAVILTFSRTGFVTLAALLMIGLFRLARRSAGLLAAGVIGLALVLLPFLPAGYLEHMGTIASIDTDPTGSAQTRWSDSLAAAKLVLASPVVGAGAGMSNLALNEARGASWAPVHNVYLEYATDLGIPGLLLFLLLLRSSFKAVTQVVRGAAQSTEAHALGCTAKGVQAMLLAFVVAGFFHPVAYHFHFYYAAGLAGAVSLVWRHEHA